MAKKRKSSRGLGSPEGDHRTNYRGHKQTQDEYVAAVERDLEIGDCSAAFHHLLLATRAAGAAAAEKHGFTPVGHATLFDNAATRASKAFTKVCKLPRARKRR